MTKFAVIDNELVTNLIVAENKEIAETVTNKICIEVADTEPVEINKTKYIDGAFVTSEQ